jgi:hypothetical protein
VLLLLHAVSSMPAKTASEARLTDSHRFRIVGYSVCGDICALVTARPRCRHGNHKEK